MVDPSRVAADLLPIVLVSPMLAAGQGPLVGVLVVLTVLVASWVSVSAQQYFQILVTFHRGAMASS